MNKPVLAQNYIVLGMRIWSLMAPRGKTYNAYVDEIRSTISDLVACEFPDSRAVAATLEGMSITYNKATGLIDVSGASRLEVAAAALQHILNHEASQRQTIGLDIARVSPRLRSLSARPLTDIQTTLLEETIRCIECQAYRAAVVMGWNLAYDCIRQWIVSNHAPAFSGQLTSRLDKKGRPVFEPINRYEDFFQKRAPSERTVLDVANELNLIGGDVYDHLCQYLRQRNNYAHPNFKALSRDQANSYIEHLITIISESPFN